MSAEVKFTLVVFAGENRVRRVQHITANVQCWRGETCVQTVDLLSGSEFEFPAEADLSTVEGFAAAISRITARKLEDVAASALSKQIVNRRAEIAEAPRHV